MCILHTLQYTVLVNVCNHGHRTLIMERPFGYYLLIPVVHSQIFYIKNIWNVFLFGNGYLIDELLAVQAVSELINVYNFFIQCHTALGMEIHTLHYVLYFFLRLMKGNVQEYCDFCLYFNVFHFNVKSQWMISNRLWMSVNRVWIRSSPVRIRSSRVWMRYNPVDEIQPMVKKVSDFSVSSRDVTN